MSRRQPQELAAGQTEAAAFGPPLLRRYVLGLLTALIVARPLVLGEDPGIVSPLTDPSNLVLSLFWMIAAVGWAVWRWWSGQGEWYAGGVEAALLAAAVLVAIGAASPAAAPYKHAAHLVAWEWLVLFLALFLVRQLAVTEADRRCLLAAFLAGVVSLSAYALYQYGVELPRERADIEKREARSSGPAEMPGLVAAGGTAGVLLREQYRAENQETLTAYEAQAARRQQERSRAFATYLRPESFAAFLVLFLPALVAVVLVRWRQGNSAMTWLSAGCLLVVVAALGAARPFVAGQQDFGDLLGCWSSTRDLIRDHVWLGAGAGNFSRLYPQYVSPSAPASVSDAHNVVLDLWATYGIFVLIAVLAGLGLFFYLALRPLSVVRGPLQETTADEPRTTDHGQRTRWEFYFGGMFGLLLGYYLRQAFQSPDEALLAPALPSSEEVMRRGLAAGIRSVVWFATFALFEGVPWTGKTMARALATGVAALLLVLVVSGGIDFPSVAQPLWLTVGLALAARGVALHRSSAGDWLGRVLPLPLLAGLLLAYLTYVFYPVLRSTSLAHDALQAGAFYLEQRAKRFPELRNPPQFLKEKVIAPIVEAAREDPTDAHRRTQAAFWYGELWRPALDLESKNLYAEQALLAVADAEKLDRYGKEAYLIDFELRRSLGRQAAQENERRRQFTLAADALKKLAAVDPTNARVQFDLAAMRFAAGEAKEGRTAARNARELDEATMHPQRQLTLGQRRRLKEWLGESD